MTDDHEDRPAIISISVLRQIIKRADELEGDRSDRIRLDEVHEIARELGLSDEAVTAAITEALAGSNELQPVFHAQPLSSNASRRSAARPLDTRSGFLGYRTAMSGALGALFGLTSGILSTLGLSALPVDIGVAGPGAMFIAMAITALRIHGPNHHRDFQIANAAGWLTFGVTFCLAYLRPFSLYRAVDLFWSFGTVSAAGGAILVAMRSLWRSRSAIVPRISGWLRRLLGRASDPPTRSSDASEGRVVRRIWVDGLAH